MLGCVAFVLIGWSGLLVPSLIRSVKDAYGQSDAGIGIFYFLYAVAYATGSLGGGLATERFGRRLILGAAVAVHAAGLIALGLGQSWWVFLLAGLPGGVAGAPLSPDSTRPQRPATRRRPRRARPHPPGGDCAGDWPRP